MSHFFDNSSAALLHVVTLYVTTVSIAADLVSTKKLPTTEMKMTPKFQAGQIVRMNDRIIQETPKYADLRFEVVALACDGWEIGRAEWYGQYSIRRLDGDQVSGCYESSLVLA